MNAPPALATRPPSSAVPFREMDEERSLAALLDLFDAAEATETATGTEAGAGSPVRAFRTVLDLLQTWTQQTLRRAIAWGAGPGGAWRAW